MTDCLTTELQFDQDKKYKNTKKKKKKKKKRRISASSVNVAIV